MKRYLLFESTKDALISVREGQKRLVKAGGKAICLVRNNEKLIACDNACPHRGHPLMEGSLNHINEIVCASHAYRFNLENGQESENRCSDLKLYPIVIEEGKVYLEC